LAGYAYLAEKVHGGVGVNGDIRRQIPGHLHLRFIDDFKLIQIVRDIMGVKPRCGLLTAGKVWNPVLFLSPVGHAVSLPFLICS
jgi:hypothetical protein